MTADERPLTANDLPPGWVWTTLGKSCEIVLGQSPPSSAYNTEGVGLPFYQGKAEFGSLYPTPVKWCSEPKKIAEAGDVLISVRAPVGPTNLCQEESCIGRGLAAVRPEAEMPNVYFLYFLRYVEQDWDSKATGTTFSAISGKVLRGQEIPLPPLAEQRRIVAQLEALFAQSLRAREALDAVPGLLAQFRQAVLAAAFRGDLTERDPADEPASVLLERIRAERHSQWEEDLRAQGKDPSRRKYKEPAPPDTSDLSVLPQGWIWTTVEQLSNVVRGASPRPAGDPQYFGGNIPWITVGCLTADTQPYLYSVPTFVTAAGREKSRYIEPETLLLTNSGATLGVPKITKIGGCINDGIVALLEVDYPLKLYLYYYLQKLTEQLRAINQGAAQPNLNTSIVKAIMVPLAPLAEQRRIVARIKALFAQADILEAQVAAVRRRLEHVDQAILARAFRGELVPQDPSDEPASVLLERIRREREAHSAKKQTRKSRSSTKEMQQLELL